VIYGHCLLQYYSEKKKKLKLKLKKKKEKKKNTGPNDVEPLSG
jgi:hypothetical protein